MTTVDVTSDGRARLDPPDAPPHGSSAPDGEAGGPDPAGGTDPAGAAPNGQVTRRLDAVVAGVGRVLAAAARPPTRVVIRCGEVRVELEWAPPAAAAIPGQPDAPGSAATPEPAGTVLVTSPMVGTFYRAPAPGAAPFVRVGELVQAGQQVGIVEAMKLMNAVNAETSGEVVAVLVDDGAPVEYGQPLVSLRPVEE